MVKEKLSCIDRKYFLKFTLTATVMTFVIYFLSALQSLLSTPASESFVRWVTIYQSLQSDLYLWRTNRPCEIRRHRLCLQTLVYRCVRRHRLCLQTLVYRCVRRHRLCLQTLGYRCVRRHRLCLQTLVYRCVRRHRLCLLTLVYRCVRRHRLCLQTLVYICVRWGVTDCVCRHWSIDVWDKASQTVSADTGL